MNWFLIGIYVLCMGIPYGLAVWLGVNPGPALVFPVVVISAALYAAGTTYKQTKQEAYSECVQVLCFWLGGTPDDMERAYKILTGEEPPLNGKKP